MVSDNDITNRDVHSIPDFDFLYPLYTGADPMWKTMYSWMDVMIVMVRYVLGPL